LLGTLENALAAVPSRGMMGGYPGATHFFNVVRGTGVLDALAERRRLPQNVDELGGEEETLINHVAGVPLLKTDVFHQITGGGAGMGDPLLRPPERVGHDVRDRYITVEQARAAYGVVCDADGVVDVAESEEARRAIRRERLGGDPTRERVVSEDWVPAVVLDGGSFACGHCGQSLGAGNWKDGAHGRSFDLASRLAEFGVRVKSRRDPTMILHEWACPGCGTLLETNLYPEGMEPLHDVQLGSPAIPDGAKPV
jgi:N-methylhydantoinase B